ncbi:MAG: hypothetical protein CL908_20420 [Deltaproteobacteria bacterium]|nr:hypothetical protein [Deltaproteobacteria bacterium]
MPSTHHTLRRVARMAMPFGLMLMVACAGTPKHQTLAQLRKQEPDLAEVRIDDGIGQAMAGYRKFLEDAPKSTLTPEAMRRLADLKLEKEYGILGDPSPAEASEVDRSTVANGGPLTPGSPNSGGGAAESDQEFERRIATENGTMYASDPFELDLPSGASTPVTGPLEAIELYDQILETYPGYPHNDQVLYQKARAYDELGRVDEAIAVADLLVAKYPESRHLDEIHFRRAEYFFTRKKFFDAEDAYSAIVATGPRSDYYELALYKLGWTLYKQMLYEEALDRYITLLDHKVSVGYDFDQTEDEADEQRTTDTYRVISLCFSEIGGAEAVGAFFETAGQREYEVRVYRHLGDFYLEKLRYNDAASVYEAFVDLYPIHQASPHFSMRVVEIYEAGEFPKLVLDSKKAFAESYGLESEYWRHFDVKESAAVLSYLKSNLKDLANHYHALYQSTERPEDRPAHFAESALWYRAYLTSFPNAPETPEINYQLADLLLEDEAFGAAASEYEHIAYDYPEHERSAAAGYAALYAYREYQRTMPEPEQEPVRRRTVASTLRFVETFPDHEHAAAVMGSAIDDLYDLGEFETAIAMGHRLIDEYPKSELAIRRSAWTVIAHSSFDNDDFEPSERAYTHVLEMTPPEDESIQDVMNNLAAAIYKQGEQANEAGDFGAAADHFLRIAQAAPLSTIRPVAEYDAGAALIRLEDWRGAAAVLESFRSSFPQHELNREATRQVALVYREEGNISRAAEEYERVAAEADEAELRREALLVAGGLYEEARLFDRALTVYRDYVTEFTHPIDPAVATRFKMAELHNEIGEIEDYHAELREIVAIDRGAGDARTDSLRTLAAKSALVLTEQHYLAFEEIELTQPFEQSLKEKERRMDAALAAFEGLVDYEVGEVTAAATFYMAEVYGEFSRALLESQRPDDLGPTELQDYEMVLEEEAFPFEEKAIDVHEKNLELMAAGVFNAWIEKSLARLAIAMPGRYAKFESSSGWIESIEGYAYQAPSASAPAEGAEAMETESAAETEGTGNAGAG